MNTRRIEVVLFDLDDTLHDDTRAYQSAVEDVARAVAAEHDIDALTLKAAYVAEAEGFWSRLTPEAFGTRLASMRMQMWRRALAAVGIDDPALAQHSAEQYHANRKKYLELFPGTLELLHTLRDVGKRLGLVTNGFSETHREKIALLRIGEMFDAIFIADEVGMMKPDPLLFAHACSKLGSAPMYGAMVGDRYDRDIRGAIEAGLFTVWLNLYDARVPSNAPPPHASVRAISDVAAVLREM